MAAFGNAFSSSSSSSSDSSMAACGRASTRSERGSSRTEALRRLIAAKKESLSSLRCQVGGSESVSARTQQDDDRSASFSSLSSSTPSASSPRSGRSGTSSSPVPPSGSPSPSIATRDDNANGERTVSMSRAYSAAGESAGMFAPPSALLPVRETPKVASGPPSKKSVGLRPKRKLWENVLDLLPPELLAPPVIDLPDGEYSYSDDDAENDVDRDAGNGDVNGGGFNGNDSTVERDQRFDSGALAVSDLDAPPSSSGSESGDRPAVDLLIESMKEGLATWQTEVEPLRSPSPSPSPLPSPVAPVVAASESGATLAASRSVRFEDGTAPGSDSPGPGEPGSHRPYMIEVTDDDSCPGDDSYDDRVSDGRGGFVRIGVGLGGPAGDLDLGRHDPNDHDDFDDYDDILETSDEAIDRLRTERNAAEERADGLLAQNRELLAQIETYEQMIGPNGGVVRVFFFF